MGQLWPDGTQTVSVCAKWNSFDDLVLTVGLFTTSVIVWCLISHASEERFQIEVVTPGKPKVDHWQKLSNKTKPVTDWHFQWMWKAAFDCVALWCSCVCVCVCTASPKGRSIVGASGLTGQFTKWSTGKKDITHWPRTAASTGYPRLCHLESNIAGKHTVATARWPQMTEVTLRVCWRTASSLWVFSLLNLDLSAKAIRLWLLLKHITSPPYPW